MGSKVTSLWSTENVPDVRGLQVHLFKGNFWLVDFGGNFHKNSDQV